MGAPNVYDTSYVNSGPGVGLSSSGSSRSSSRGVETGSKNIEAVSDSLYISGAKSIAKAMTTSPAGQFLRDEFYNPSNSAYSNALFNDFMSDFGVGYDMDDYYKRILSINNDNNAWSEKQAQKQMDFQTLSNKTAMAWSAQEAQKSRDWTESLSNTAHQREVQDLVKAGINPILSANNGAYSGSGATGQGFSSSGAMGQTDMSGSGVIGSLASNIMNSAMNYKLMQMQLEQQKYNVDMQYAAAKLSAGASIYNNNNSVSAQKAISQLNREADITKAGITADATKFAAGQTAGAMMTAASTNAQAAKYSADKHLMSAVNSANASRYSSDKMYDLGMYEATHNIRTDPATWGFNTGFGLGTTALGVLNGYKNLFNEHSGKGVGHSY